MRDIWQKHLDLVAAASDGETVRRRVLDCAAELAPGMLGSGTGLEQWRGFGVRVVRRDLGQVRGLLRRTAQGNVVAVNVAEHARTQRFTVAHELGHLLLADIDRETVGLSGPQEERLCEDFASHLLIPRDDLGWRLECSGDDPAELLSLSTFYDVGISALLTAAANPLAEQEVVAFATSLRGHRKRPEEVAFRVHQIRCGPYLMPAEIRVSSLGLTCLDHRLQAHDGAVEIADSDVAVNLRLWTPGAPSRSGIATGPASWRARRLANGIAVVCLNTPALNRRWSTMRFA